MNWPTFVDLTIGVLAKLRAKPFRSSICAHDHLPTSHIPDRNLIIEFVILLFIKKTIQSLFILKVFISDFTIESRVKR
jgi:hypothetical protein